MEQYETPLMEVVELDDSIVTFNGLPQFPGHGGSGNQSASC